MFQALAHGFKWDDILELTLEWRKYIDAVKSGNALLPSIPATLPPVRANYRDILTKWMSS